MWDPSVFRVSSTIKNPNYLLVSGNLVGCNYAIDVFNIYAPQGLGDKRVLWGELIGILDNHNGMKILEGDFNVVRSPEERLNSVFCPTSAADFNDFIHQAGIKEFRMGGMKFMFCYGEAINFSKLDRILVCDEFWGRWPDASLLAHPRRHSDHSPLTLTTSSHDFGPIPFKFYSSWMSKPDLRSLVESAYKEAHQINSNLPSDISLIRKL